MLKIIYRAALVLGLVWLVVLTVPTKADAVAKYWMEPATGSHGVGSSWTVTVKIDTQTQNVLSGDVEISFDSTLVEISAKAGSYFANYNDPSIDTAAGTIRLTGDQGSSTNTKSGSGTMATMVVKALTAGTATLSFACTSGQTTDSNILDAQANDVIDCAGTNVGKGTYTLTSTTTVTPTATPTGTLTITPSPSLPVTGSIPATVGLIGLGLLTLMAGLVLIF